MRLAFARYQQHAICGQELSDIVLAEYVQLSDAREVIITKDNHDPRIVHVSLYGNSFEGDPDAGEAHVSCWLEIRCARQVNGESTWVPEGEPIPWRRTTREGRACWYGQLQTLELPRDQSYRVTIVEEERYKLEADETRTGAFPSIST